MKKFKEFNTWVVEKDEHKKSSTYKKLTPKMKKVVDEIFAAMEKNPGTLPAERAQFPQRF